MAYTTLECTVEDGVAIITITRPKALNALNSKTLEELAQAFDQIAAEEDIRVLILTGSGEKAFVAGADIGEMSTFTPLQARAFARKGQAVISRAQSLAIPVIAAVNGYALGGGCELALACDFIYASDKAIFGLPEINLGLIPGFGGTQRLPRLIGPHAAKEMILTGRYVPAQEAHRIGLVTQVFAPAELMEGALATAKTMASKGKTALRAAKHAVGQGLNADLCTGLGIECDAFALCMASPDAREGTGAFLEKRKPVFTGKLNG